MKSKRLSNTSTRLPKPPPFFIDRSCGGVLLAEAIRAWDWSVHVHRVRYGDRKKIDDDRWILDAGEKNWRIITSDKDLETRYHNAIVQANAGIFVLSDLHEGESYEGWVRMLGTCKHRIVHDSHFAPRPFVARISYEGHIYRVHHLLAHGRVRDATDSVSNHSLLFLAHEVELKSQYAEAIRV